MLPVKLAKDLRFSRITEVCQSIRIDLNDDMVKIPDICAAKRYQFYSRVAHRLGEKNVGFFVVAHCLKDLPHLLHSLAEIGEVLAVACIPYSIDANVLSEIKARFPTLCPTMGELNDANYLSALVTNQTTTKDIILIEVGGYFARCTGNLQAESRVIGVIEDTEAGHRAYASAVHLPFPVISVARSQLKIAEDVLVGPATVFSVEKALRGIDRPIDGLHATVLGFGKIGQGAALALRSKYCVVSVFDPDPVLRVQALANGYKVPDRTRALGSADLIIGASGYQSITADDFQLLKSGAILASSSSKQIEFDVSSIKRYLPIHARISESIDCYASNHRRLLLLNDGTPVNFADGSIIGPIISIVHAEIILSIGELMDLHSRSIVGIHENRTEIRNLAATLWLSEFVDEKSGRYVECA